MTATIEAPSAFVQSLVDVRQQQLAGLFKAGMPQKGLRLVLREGACVGGVQHDAGHPSRGPLPAGRWEVWEVRSDGYATLIRLPRRGEDDYGEHFAQVAWSDLRKFEAE